jgi:hypothetical protein
VRRVVACLACCRKHNGGHFDPRFRLRLVSSVSLSCEARAHAGQRGSRTNSSSFNEQRHGSLKCW